MTAQQDKYDNWENKATVNYTYETCQYMKNAVYEFENNIKQMDEATAELIREGLKVAGLELTDRDGDEIFFPQPAKQLHIIPCKQPDSCKGCPETCPPFRPRIDIQYLRKEA